MSGTLIIHVIDGKLIRDTDFLSKMDPYIVFKSGNLKNKYIIGNILYF